MKGACSALQPAYGIGSAPHLFCFGFGYSARALARRLMDEGWIISGTCRSEEKRAALAARGIRAFLFDRDRPLLDAPAAFDGVTDILTSIPPDATGDPVLDQHGEVIAAARGLHWIGYLSTTGVYGDTGGAVVDETAPLCPTSERSRRRVEAERRWLDLFGARRCPCATRRRWHGQPVHVFRLAGIYGPGRSAIDQVRRGEMRRIDKPGHLFSRIHVDDIGAVPTTSATTSRRNRRMSSPMPAVCSVSSRRRCCRSIGRPRVSPQWRSASGATTGGSTIRGSRPSSA
jgi:nucleoside-diphosphate-sugar epimerase